MQVALKIFVDAIPKQGLAGRVVEVIGMTRDFSHWVSPYIPKVGFLPFCGYETDNDLKAHFLMTQLVWQLMKYIALRMVLLLINVVLNEHGSI